MLSRHLEYYLKWCWNILRNYGNVLQSDSMPYLSCLRALIRVVGSHEKEIMRMSDDNMFTLEFLNSQMILASGQQEDVDEVIDNTGEEIESISDSDGKGVRVVNDLNDTGDNEVSQDAIDDDDVDGGDVDDNGDNGDNEYEEMTKDERKTKKTKIDMKEKELVVGKKSNKTFHTEDDEETTNSLKLKVKKSAKRLKLRQEMESN